MPYDRYEFVRDAAGDFEKRFEIFALSKGIAASRLVKCLEAFAKDRRATGYFVRGLGVRSIYALPSKEAILGGESGLLALVDDKARTVCPMRFLPPSPIHLWKSYEIWAEATLGS